MSNIVLPGYLAEERAMQRATEEATAKADEAAKESGAPAAKQLPTPCGYKMLIGIPKVEDKYESGLIKADAVIKQDEVATVVGFVIAMGPDCYKDTEKFPSGPFCKEGDFVLLRTYAGTRFKIHGTEFRLINDDSVEAVVEDPRGYTRA